jgi:asparagine synthase (glutamine-hydrolysing)
MSAFAIALGAAAVADIAAWHRVSGWLKQRAQADLSQRLAAQIRWTDSAPAVADFAFDGWLRDPAALARQLGLPASTSDAQIAHAFLQRRGPRALAELDGSWALAWRRGAGVLLARDALGVRTLFYRWQLDRVLIASEPMAIVVADPQPPQIDAGFLAHQLALRAGLAQRSAFAGISELAPAHWIELDASESPPAAQCFWRPSSDIDRGRSFDHHAERYRELLTESIRAHTRGVNGFALTLSGGMDSGSVLALLPAAGADALLKRTVSYGFDVLSDADERAFAFASRAAVSVPAEFIRADGDWPLKGGAEFPVSPNVPILNPYGAIKRQINERVRAAGCDTLLTGTFGDHLYPPQHCWLEDALAHGALGQVARCLWTELKNHRFNLGQSVQLRRAARRFLLADRIKPFRPPWLTDAALKEIDPFALLWAGHRGHRRLATGLVAAQDCSGEAFFSEHEGVQWRNPFRDRPLIEHALSVPAHIAHRNGIKKAHARHALRGLLPPLTRQRIRKTSLIALYRRGIAEAEAERVRALLDAPGALWPQFVRPAFIANGAPGRRANESDEAVLWLVLCVELWWQRALEAHALAQREAA